MEIQEVFAQMTQAVAYCAIFDLGTKEERGIV